MDRIFVYFSAKLINKMTLLALHALLLGRTEKRETKINLCFLAQPSDAMLLPTVGAQDGFTSKHPDFTSEIIWVNHRRTMKYNYS